MRRGVLVLVCLWASVAGMAGPRPCEVRAADPPKVAAAAEPATIDQLMKQLADLRAQKAEIEKREKATLAELRARLELLRDLLRELDVDPPTPPTPTPDDITATPLYKAAAAAYGADVSATKTADKTALAGVYRSLARTAVPDPTVATVGDLARVAQQARAAAVGDRLAPVREIFGGDFEPVVGTDPAAPLTPAIKAEVKTRFERYAGILGAIK